MAEGVLRYVQASASGGDASGLGVWATASAPSNGVFAYVQSFSFTSARQMTTVSDRGKPIHHKETSKDPINVTFQCLWTGQTPLPASANGASIQAWHLEFKASNPEEGGTGRYYQFYGAAVQQNQFTENAEGDTIDFTVMALGMSGANASGYLG
jgi:hypothetical protein